MASRLARSAAGKLLHALRAINSPIGSPKLTQTPSPPGAALRPTFARTTLPAITSLASNRYASSGVPAEEPKKKAQSILDSLPGNSLLSKTAILSSAAGVSIYAISNEYYIVNEETVIAFCLLSVWAGLIRYGGPMYKEWAEAQNEKIKGILNAARADHTQAVKDRIENVQQMGSVVDVTKILFEVSKVRIDDVLAVLRGVVANYAARKPPSSRLRRTNLSRRLLSPRKPRLFWTPGFGTRARSSSVNRGNWPRLLSLRSTRSSKIPRSCNRFYSKASLKSRVSLAMARSTRFSANSRLLEIVSSKAQ
jgi:hypothetical protein